MREIKAGGRVFSVSEVSMNSESAAFAESAAAVLLVDCVATLVAMLIFSRGGVKQV